MFMCGSMPFCILTIAITSRFVFVQPHLVASCSLLRAQVQRVLNNPQLYLQFPAKLDYLMPQTT